VKNRLIYIVFCIILLLFFATPGYTYYSGKEIPKNKIQIPKRIIVKLNSDIDNGLTLGKSGNVTGVADFDAVNQKYGIKNQRFLHPSKKGENRPWQFRNTLIINVPGNVDIDEIIREYKKLNTVAEVSADFQLELYEALNDPLYIHQWALNNNGQEYYHVLRQDGDFNDILVTENGLPGADIDAQIVLADPPNKGVTTVLAIIDTGLDMDHPDLVDRLWTNANEIQDNGLDDDHNGYVDDVNGWHFGGNPTTGFLIPIDDNDPTDEHGHGTHCAGIAAAITGNSTGIAGTCQYCKIMPLSFHPFMLVSFAAKAIVYAVDNGADVISMSWGKSWPMWVVEDAINYARTKGVVLVAAAGNDSSELTNYPAAYEGVIAVGATNSSDLITSFSTYGSYLSVCAPGQSILSLRADTTDMYAGDLEPDVHIINDYYYLASGTSMSCPYVAGIATFMRSLSPGLNTISTKAIIESSAEDMLDPYGTGDNLPGFDIFSGYGRANLRLALDATPRLGTAILWPQNNQIVSGLVDIYGEIVGNEFPEYVLEFGAGKSPEVWTEIARYSHPTSDQILATWNTAGLNGQYTIRTRLNNTHLHCVTLHVSNISQASISVPVAQEKINGHATIIGTASNQNFISYSLEFGHGETPNSWYEIITSEVPIVDGELGLWQPDTLSPGVYSLKLTLFDAAGSTLSDTVVITYQTPFSGENGWRNDIDADVPLFPTYGDFNNDNVNEIVIGTSGGIKFFDIDGGLLHDGVPETPPYNFITPIAVGDIDGDGIEDMAAAGIDENSVGYTGRLIAAISSEPDFEIVLEVPPDISRFSYGEEYKFPYVSLKDVNDDGKDEIHFSSGSADPEYFVFNANGSLRIHIPLGYRGHYSADIDGNGLDEYYMVSYEWLYMTNEEGNLIDSVDMRYDLRDELHNVIMSAVDIDYDTKYELILFGLLQDDYKIYAFDENLALKPGWPHSSGIAGFFAPSAPLFADINVDSSIDYFVSYWDLDFAYVYGWQIDGTPFGNNASSPLFATTPNPGILYPPIIADMDSDGYPDMVACAEPDAFYTYVRALVTIPNPWNYLRLAGHIPTIGDINGDGAIDLLMTNPINQLIFANFKDNPYLAESSPICHWRYNRRMNNAGFILTSPTDVANDEAAVLPDKYELAQNYPNPFNPNTRVKFSLPELSNVNLTVFNILGQKVKTLVNKQLPAGSYTAAWDGTDSDGKALATGIYLYRLKADNYSASRKMLLVK
jgi:subtilisin family serine protease